MFSEDLFLTILVFIGGIVAGILLTLGFSKLRTGSVSATSVRREMEDYQAEVEAHFEQTSEKFKNLAEQYQELYQHMAVGATSLCRPENVAPGLIDDSARVGNKQEAVTAEPEAGNPDGDPEKDEDSNPDSASSSKP